MKLKNILVFILLLVFNSKASYSQVSNFDSNETIYSDLDITVAIKYKFGECGQTGRKNKIYYKLTGKLSPKPKYIIFKIDYLDCVNRKLYFIQQSINIGQGGKLGEFYNMDENFSGIVKKTFYDVIISTKPIQNSGLNTYTFGYPPDFIIGPDTVLYNETFNLSIKGGYLPDGADWIWYNSECGGEEIGKGENISINLKKDGFIYVRGVGNGLTLCTSKYFKVNPNSFTPDHINGPKEICIGDSAELSISGGTLGEGAKWIWYEDECGKKQIGIGNKILVSPRINTRYFVKGKGIKNETNCVEHKILVSNISVVADRISGTSQICKGESVTLSVDGGHLGQNAKWVWFTENCGDQMSIGDSSIIMIAPEKSMDLFVRAEGICNITECVKQSIEVQELSITPTSIYVPDSVRKNEKITLRIIGGHLGYQANWVWYKSTCDSLYNKIAISQLDSLEIKAHKIQEYSVIGKGFCNNTECINAQIFPSMNRKWSNRYSEKNYMKSFHIGFGLGMTYCNIEAITQRTFRGGNFTKEDSIVSNIQGEGLKGEIVLHFPIHKNFSFGLSSGYDKGTSFHNLLKNKTDKKDIKYNFNKILFGCELAFGPRPVKILMAWSKSIEDHNFSSTVLENNSTENIIFRKNYDATSVSLGLRFGAYGNKNYKRGVNFDLYYNISKYSIDKFQIFNRNDYTNLEFWNQGIGCSLWIQNILKCGFSSDLAVFNSKYKNENAPEGTSVIRFSLVFFNDLFY